MRPDHRPFDRGHNQNGKGPAFKALLRFHVLVAGKKHLKAFALDQDEQRTVLDAAPFHGDDSVNIMLRQEVDQLSRYVLVEKNPQCCACN
jgi:hypothetical protein